MKRGLNAFSLVQIYEGNVSFVRHREENSVGLLSWRRAGASLLFRAKLTALLPWLSRDCWLRYLSPLSERQNNIGSKHCFM
jgi:hypothetical protein